jgi:hypothetical protein
MAKEKAEDLLVKALARYFGVDIPEKKNGKYCYDSHYDWVSGCTIGRDYTWLTLENVVYALSDFCDEFDWYAEEYE